MTASVGDGGTEGGGRVAAGPDAASAGGGICAVVVTHESAETIDACLECLRAAEGVDAVRVVDNASRDGTLEIVQRHALADPRVRFIANPDNPGFATACNTGADGVDARWLAFVNPDCLPAPDSLSRLRTHADAVPRDALLGADLIDVHGERDAAARRRDPQLAAMLWSAAARDLSLAVDPSRALQPVEAVSGALMFLSRALFERLGGFDAGYRLHAEDLDLCRRAREAGAMVAVANDVRVVHVRGVSSRARPLFVEWHKHRGMWRYFSKFEARGRSAAVRALVFAGLWARFKLVALRTLFRR